MCVWVRVCVCVCVRVCLSVALALSLFRSEAVGSDKWVLLELGHCAHPSLAWALGSAPVQGSISLFGLGHKAADVITADDDDAYITASN